MSIDIKQSYKSLIIGLNIIVFYKFFKFLADLYLDKQGILGLDLYNSEQFLYTLYRIGATIFGTWFVLKHFKYPKNEFSVKNFRFIKILSLVLVLYTLRQFLGSSGTVNISPNFNLEIFYNLFTGFYEEFIFKGVILCALFHFCKPRTAIIIAALIFSFWHYDTISHPIDYIGLFIFGFCTGYYFYYKCPLLLLAIFHFLWDQIYFGFTWLSWGKFGIFFWGFFFQCGFLATVIYLVEKYKDQTRVM